MRALPALPFVGLLLQLAAPASGQPLVEDWRALVDGDEVNDAELDTGFAVALHPSGDAIAAGILANAGTLDDFAVVRLSGDDGGEVWRRTIDGSETLAAFDFDLALDVAVDGAGDVIAAGTLANDASTLCDILVVKLDGDSGAVLWDRAIDGPASGFDEALALALAGSDALVAGVLEGASGPDFFVARIDGASGSVTWDVAIDGSATTDDDDLALDVAVDAAGNALAVGRLTEAGSADDFLVVKLRASDGVELWRRRFDGSSSGAGADFDQADAVIVDGSGAVVAGGSLENAGTLDDGFVVALDPGDGQTLWDATIDGAASGSDAVQALARVGDDIAAAGFLDVGGASGQDLLVLRLDGDDGSERWRYTADGTAAEAGVENASAVAASSGSVFAVGTLVDAADGEDLAVVALDPASGAEQGLASLDGGVQLADGAQDVVAAGAGRALVAGFLGGPSHAAGGGADDLAVLKVPAPAAAAAGATVLCALAAVAAAARARRAPRPRVAGDATRAGGHAPHPEEEKPALPVAGSRRLRLLVLRRSVRHRVRARATQSQAA